VDMDVCGQQWRQNRKLRGAACIGIGLTYWSDA